MCLTIKNTTAVLMLLFAGIATAGQSIWQDATPGQLQAKSLDSKIHQYSADHVALRNALSLAPHESSGDLSQQIELPMPDGSLERFTIVESPIMEPALAARYPEIKTFKVYGIDDPMASGRADITPRGFHAMLRTSKGRLFIDPDDATGLYQSRFRSGQPRGEFSCGVHRVGSELVDQGEFLQMSANRSPGNLLTYRLAVAATEEYVAEIPGGTVADAQSAIVTAITRVNLIYESDLGIRLILVANNNLLIDNGTNVSFSNNDTFALLNKNQAWIDETIGNTAYDIGHVFSTGAGGAAFLGSACNNPTKAKGTSGQSDPTGAPFWIDYVAHEIGHQFNAEHSFNGTTSSCDVGRNSATAFEPGSGSTVMAYAGICQQENLQLNSDPTFHAGSIAQIDSFTRGAGSCANSVVVDLDPGPMVKPNSDPTIAAIPDRVIPANTPFVLDIDNTPFPSDPDMDALEYQWDQMDAGCPTDLNSFGTDNGSNALFRSYIPRSDFWRNFPALGTQVRGRFDKAEVLPCQNRNLNFRLTARDGNSGQDTEDVRVSVDNSAGPFEITSLNPPPPTPITAGTAFGVNWDVANTDLPPVNCMNVDFDLISFSDGYADYSIYPLDAASNDNDGSEFVTLDPTIANPISEPHPRSRVRVKCRDNIFYALSGTDLTIEGDTMFPEVTLDDTALVAYSFVTPAIAMATAAPACGLPVECTPPPEEESSGKSGGSGAIDYLWLLLMTAVIALVKVCRRYGLQ